MLNNYQVYQLLEIITSALRSLNLHCDNSSVQQIYLEFFEYSELDELSCPDRIEQLRSNLITRTSLSPKDFFNLTKDVLLNGRLVNVIANEDKPVVALDKVFEILAFIEDAYCHEEQHQPIRVNDNNFSLCDYPLIKAY